MNNNYIFKYAERKANKFNLYCLFVMTFLALIAGIFNEIGIFTLDKFAVRLLIIELSVISLFPTVMLIINDKILKKEESILEKSFFKVIIVVSAFLDILSIYFSLSYHVTLLLAVPSLMSAQYRKNRKMFVVSLISSLILVVLSVFGAFIYGVYDANLLKPLTAEEAEIIENRIALLTKERIISVTLHHIIPKLLCIAAINFIGLSITNRTSEIINIQIESNRRIQDEIMAKAKLQNSVIEHLADIIESRDLETGEHIKRTKKYVSILVNKMKDMDKYRDFLTPEMCENIINAAPLHDIGKIAVSDIVLRKPGKLTSEEFDQMKIHTIKGGEIINKILNDFGNEEFLKVAYDIATSHHEKWNGMGYPYGLKEENIPLPGRIMAIADVFDALVAERVYKKPIPLDDAINIIINDSGTHFDPNLIEVFKEVLEDFRLASVEKL